MKSKTFFNYVRISEFHSVAGKAASHFNKLKLENLFIYKVTLINSENTIIINSNFTISTISNGK